MAVSPTTGRGIVTPEAVLLEFEMGGVGSRTVARLIDLILQVLLVVFGIGALGTVLGPVLTADYGGAIIAVMAALIIFLALFGYPVVMELGSAPRSASSPSVSGSSPARERRCGSGTRRSAPSCRSSTYG